MGPRDWFSVGVRLFGVWVIFDGFTYLMAAFSERLAYFSQSQVARQFETAENRQIDYMVYAVGALAFGFILIWGGERLTRWAFSEPSPAQLDSSHQPE